MARVHSHGGMRRNGHSSQIQLAPFETKELHSTQARTYFHERGPSLARAFQPFAEDVHWVYLEDAIR